MCRRDDQDWWVVVVAVVGLLLLLGLLVRMVVRGANLFRLLNLLMTVVVAFALGFYAVAVNTSGQFVGIRTRVDSFYFVLTTMTTTGYGDIRATGQLARILVSLAFIFDVIFLGLLGAELTNRVRRQSERTEAPS